MKFAITLILIMLTTNIWAEILIPHTEWSNFLAFVRKVRTTHVGKGNQSLSLDLSQKNLTVSLNLGQLCLTKNVKNSKVTYEIDFGKIWGNSYKAKAIGSWRHYSFNNDTHPYRCGKYKARRPCFRPHIKKVEKNFKRFQKVRALLRNDKKDKECKAEMLLRQFFYCKTWGPIRYTAELANCTLKKKLKSTKDKGRVTESKRRKVKQRVDPPVKNANPIEGAPPTVKQ